MPSPSVATILRDHVSLSTSCIDRLYLNGYVPKLQSSGQLCAFLCDHLGNRIASPAALRPLHDRFIQAVGSFADQLLLFCYHYDPMTGRYGIYVMRTLRVAGVATVLLIGTFIVVMVRRERSQQKPAH